VVDARDRQRLAVAHRILGAVRQKNFRDDTLSTKDGDHVFVPALPDDTMARLFDQLRNTDGPLHVFVPEGDELTIFVMAPHTPPKHASRRSDSYCPVSPESHVSMVLQYMRLKGGRILCREETPEISMQLVEADTGHPNRSGVCNS
jgi:hypothetical protein